MKALQRRLQRVERSLPPPTHTLTAEEKRAWCREHGIDLDAELVGWPNVVVLPREEDLDAMSTEPS